MTSSWGQFRDFINSKEIGHIFTRPELCKAYTGWGTYTPDSYRLLLCKAKFLSHVSRGKYRLESHMPDGLTMGSLFALLKGDNLTYIESIQKQKKAAILKEQFLEDRKVIIEKLLVELQNCLTFVRNSDYLDVGLSASHLIRQLRQWKKELKLSPNPTKAWLIKYQANESKESTEIK